MFEESVEKYDSAAGDIDYVTSILLSGAVVGIVAPLLEEQGGHPYHNLLARIGNATNDGEKKHPGMYREIYNSLKHTGHKRNKVEPSDDLEFYADLKSEAEWMLDAAKSDFREVKMSFEVRKTLSKSFLDLLDSDRMFA